MHMSEKLITIQFRARELNETALLAYWINTPFHQDQFRAEMRKMREALDQLEKELD